MVIEGAKKMSEDKEKEEERIRGENAILEGFARWRKRNRLECKDEGSKNAERRGGHRTSGKCCFVFCSTPRQTHALDRTGKKRKKGCERSNRFPTPVGAEG